MSNIMQAYDDAIAARKAARDADRKAHRKERVELQRQLALSKLYADDARRCEQRKLERRRLVSREEAFS